MIISNAKARNTFRSVGGGSPGHHRAFIHSHEGGIYLLEIEREGVSQVVEDVIQNSPRRFSSLVTAKDFAKKQGVEQIIMGLQSTYDEMIGLASIT